MPPPFGHAIANALRRPRRSSRPMAECGGLMMPDAGSMVEVDGYIWDTGRQLPLQGYTLCVYLNPPF